MDLIEFKSPLHEAAHNALADKVKELLAGGASISDVDSLDQTPLIMAVRRRAEDSADAERMAVVAQMLIDAGSDVNAFDKNGEACIHLAVMSGGGVEKVAVLKVLIDAKVDTAAVSDTFKMTALQCAATRACAPGVVAGHHSPAPCSLTSLTVPAQLGRCGRTHRDCEAVDRRGLPQEQDQPPARHGAGAGQVQAEAGPEQHQPSGRGVCGCGREDEASQEVSAHPRWPSQPPARHAALASHAPGWHACPSDPASAALTRGSAILPQVLCVCRIPRVGARNQGLSAEGASCV